MKFISCIYQPWRIWIKSTDSWPQKMLPSASKPWAYFLRCHTCPWDLSLCVTWQLAWTLAFILSRNWIFADEQQNHGGISDDLSINCIPCTIWHFNSRYFQLRPTEDSGQTSLQGIWPQIWERAHLVLKLSNSPNNKWMSSAWIPRLGDFVSPSSCYTNFKVILWNDDEIGMHSIKIAAKIKNQ